MDSLQFAIENKKGSANCSALPFFMGGVWLLPAKNFPGRNAHFWFISADEIGITAIGTH